MPDIDPAALSRPAVTLSTPVLATKSLSINATGAAKITKTSQIIPARIDLEPLYGALKAAISSEQWLVYKESIAEFLTGTKLHDDGPRPSHPANSRDRAS